LGEIILEAGRGNYPHGNRILEGKTLWSITESTEDWRITVGVIVEVDITVGDTFVITVGKTITVDGTLVVTERAVMIITVGDCITVVRTGAWWGGLSVQGG